MDMAAMFKVGVDTPGLPNLERFNKTLQQTGPTGEMSAKQIRQAMRSLPAQFTDIAVSLAGGQSPFMVLLQQGGQIRDQFGSIGAAFRGITSVLTPARIGFLGVATAVAGLVKAFNDGQKESADFANAIALTGGAAGITQGQFRALAEQLTQTTSASIGASKELLQLLVSTGSIGANALKPAAEAIQRIVELSGKEAEEVSRQITSVGGRIDQYASKLNQTYNFLNVTQFKRIQQLDIEGKREEALKITLDLLNESLAKRGREITWLTSFVQGATSIWSSFWDAVSGIGRQKTLEDNIKEAERLVSIRRSAAEANPYNEKYAAGLKVAEARLAALRQEQERQNSEALKGADVARKNQKAIENEIKARDEAPKERKRQEDIERRRQEDFAEWLAGIQQEQLDNELELLKKAEKEKERQDENDRKRQEDFNNWLGGIQEEQLQKELDYAKKSKGAFDDYRKSLVLTQNEIEELAIRSTQALEDGLVDVIMRTKSVGEAFRDMARIILQELARIAIRQLIVAPFANALNSYLGNIGSSLGATSTAPAGGVEGGTGLTLPRRASGGAVTSGAPYMVGEAGPELFVPQQSGNIISNDKLGGGSVVINQTINVTTGVQQTVRTEIAALLPQISEAAKSAVLDAKKRGGSFSAAFA
jgi:phage-related minor tail protein